MSSVKRDHDSKGSESSEATTGILRRLSLLRFFPVEWLASSRLQYMFFAIKISSLCVYIYIYQDYHEDNTNMIFFSYHKKNTHTVFLVFHLLTRKTRDTGRIKKRVFHPPIEPPMKYLFIRLLSSDRDQTVSQAAWWVCGTLHWSFFAEFGNPNFLWVLLDKFLIWKRNKITMTNGKSWRDDPQKNWDSMCGGSR